MNQAGRLSMMRGGASAPPGPPAYWGLCFTAEEPGVVVNMSKNGTPPAVSLETSIDGVEWTSFDADGGTTPITLASVGDKVYFRSGASGNSQFASNSSAYRMFTLSGFCGASGNIMSLLSQQPSTVLLSGYTFARLFYSCQFLTATPELPATTLADNCYRQIFYGCTSLTAAPELPATTLASYCYFSMFYGCTSLSTAPELPATTLAQSCYSQMFYGCTSLSTAPELPATTLAQSCYSSMFFRCTSLTAAPELPATTLTQGCYVQMFSGCASLSYIKVHFTEWTSGRTNVWVNSVSASGTFVCPSSLGTDATITRATSNCPTGWTVINFD